jgi:hypothetical protein
MPWLHRLLPASLREELQVLGQRWQLHLLLQVAVMVEVSHS